MDDQNKSLIDVKVEIYNSYSQMGYSSEHIYGSGDYSTIIEKAYVRKTTNSEGKITVADLPSGKDYTVMVYIDESHYEIEYGTFNIDRGETQQSNARVDYYQLYGEVY